MPNNLQIELKLKICLKYKETSTSQETPNKNWKKKGVRILDG